jgi:hypothetical protein
MAPLITVPATARVGSGFVRGAIHEGMNPGIQSRGKDPVVRAVTTQAVDRGPRQR